jgi:rubredoxin
MIPVEICEVCHSRMGPHEDHAAALEGWWRCGLCGHLDQLDGVLHCTVCGNRLYARSRKTTICRHCKPAREALPMATGIELLWLLRGWIRGLRFAMGHPTNGNHTKLQRALHALEQAQKERHV